jgi:mono/diheme cytochrome c family protein
MMRVFALIGLVAALALIGAAIFFFGGFYSVAGTAGDSAVVSWSLARIRWASIARHAGNNPAASLEDPAIVQAGARAYATRGCTNCHGAPGVDWARFAEGLRPEPPDLKELAPDRTPQQLFWVVKNGIKMTGMPSFRLIDVPDQEIWSIVAFVKKLPSVSDDDFKTWTGK